ncbi:hypothetical protein Tsubulata_050232 [Turnera subulata]|uniref:DM2 domain-containing protein n=1 Tax=Turnera subulata TaxID=218843 RepID=A0A9Q0FEZ7_9ROSI|nr:hypothetical protein Tsubulata_050232 [Turnera subulata]
MQGATGSRVFGACRALLAPAKSSATATATVSKPTATSTPKSKPKPKPKAKEGSGSTTPRARVGILKPTPISSELSHFLGGAPEASRAEVTKKIWDHIKAFNLQDPTNRREIMCDEKLKVLFDGKEKVNMLEIAKLTSRHFLKSG